MLSLKPGFPYPLFSKLRDEQKPWVQGYEVPGHMAVICHTLSGCRQHETQCSKTAQQPLSRQPLQSYLLAFSMLQHPDGSTSTREQRKPGVCMCVCACEGEGKSKNSSSRRRCVYEREGGPRWLALRSSDATQVRSGRLSPSSSTMMVCPWREFLHRSNCVIFSTGIQWNTGNTLGSSCSPPYCNIKDIGELLEKPGPTNLIIRGLFSSTALRTLNPPQQLPP